MKLINKKTGEIVEFVGCTAKGMRTFLRFDDLNGSFKFEVGSLAELINNGWEDVEELEHAELDAQEIVDRENQNAREFASEYEEGRRGEY